MAYRQCVEAGPGAKLNRILDIYRNEEAVQAHFSSRHNSQPSVHQVSSDSNSPKEGGEEDIHKLHDKRSHNQNTRPSSPENRYIQWWQNMPLVWKQPQAMRMPSVW